MTVDKNQIAKSRPDRFQNSVRYGRRRLIAGHIFDSGMAAEDQRRWTWMETDLIVRPEVFRSLPNVLQHHLLDVTTPCAAQSGNVSRSILPWIVDFPIPIPIPIRFLQMPADTQQLLARRFSRESNQLSNYRLFGCRHKVAIELGSAITLPAKARPSQEPSRCMCSLRRVELRLEVN
jgi:hypothetical protein